MASKNQTEDNALTAYKIISNVLMLYNRNYNVDNALQIKQTRFRDTFGGLLAITELRTQTDYWIS